MGLPRPGFSAMRGMRRAKGGGRGGGGGVQKQAFQKSMKSMKKGKGCGRFCVVNLRFQRGPLSVGLKLKILDLDELKNS